MSRARAICIPVLFCLFLLIPGLPLQPSDNAAAQTPTDVQRSGGQNQAGLRPDLRPGYAGDAACASCHRDQSLSYLHTAHHLTSQLPNAESLPGSFTPGSNVLTIVDAASSANHEGLYFTMEKKDDGYYETATGIFTSGTKTRSEKIGIVTGSGVRGQTYLYWRGDELFELPISYWTNGHQWINSPGYRDGSADYSRPILQGCLECHASYIRALTPSLWTNRFDPASFEPGISCESCHGPGVEHIRREVAGSARREGPAILNPAKFSRDRQVDLCSLCHSGLARNELAPAFSYVPGQPLDRYFQQLAAPAAEHPDVHGNQAGLLKRSKCYLSSPGMTCSTCHDEHAPERAAASYSSRCLTCHQWKSCRMSTKLGHKITDNCIDCHMPLEPTAAIASETAGRVVRGIMRNHWIRVYSGTEHP
ncbi:multiheme c-type cytochrome [Paracidobacterium acidisoli]|uniref:Cytochrome c-552/4 domain-containing protein n=1 Tax=Paracidobacterium acidisoli TaxID=2303751 RepID=A0A372IU56_9BACT|nr:multiheme c-type cytochrome [Paracidobacterium acidisoli]MBT9329896.1 hypothetical protein [Paracidobacterium acidisoli]